MLMNSFSIKFPNLFTEANILKVQIDYDTKTKSNDEQ